MRVLNIIPEKINVTFTMDLDELVLLREALTMCELNYNGKSPRDVEVKQFFVSTFSKTIIDVVNDLSGENEES